MLALTLALVAFAASVGWAQEGSTGELSPLEPSSCTYPLSSWQTQEFEWPVEQLNFAGAMYTRDELAAVLTTADDGTLRADVALAQQLIAYKLNLLQGAIPSTQAIDAAAEAESLFQLYVGGLPSGDDALSADELELFSALAPALEAANAANVCADAAGG